MYSLKYSALYFVVSLALASGQSCTDATGSIKLSDGTKKTCSQFNAFWCKKYPEGPKNCPVTCDSCGTNGGGGGGTSCVDATGSIKLSDGTKKTCSQFNAFWCKKYPEGPKNCPVTCDSCGTNGGGGGGTSCVDATGSIKLSDGTKKTCSQFNAFFCKKYPEGPKNCPVKCDSCGTNGGGGGGTSCVDATGWIKLSDGSKKKCSQFNASFCKKYPEGPAKCPVKCNSCGGKPPTASPTASPTVCEDAPGFVLLDNGGKKKCSQMTWGLCKANPIAATKCKVKCKKCTLPTASPTTKPSRAPSVVPSSKPSSVPSLTPTSLPSSTPTDYTGPYPTCVLKAVLTMPSLDDFVVNDVELNGYHSDYMEISKVGSNEVCNYWNPLVYDPSKRWECEHEGWAEISRFVNETPYSSSAWATITKAGRNTYKFIVRHDFSDYETYYDLDHRFPATLKIEANGVKLGSYTHPQNKLVDSHTSAGRPNPAFAGSFEVDIACDVDCVCTSVKTLPTCNILSTVSFPIIKGSVNKAPYYGYHNDYLTVSRSGHANFCDYETPHTDWGCTHTGDAKILNEKESDSYDSSTIEMAQVFDATDSDFLFTLKHYFNDKLENYYNQDYKMTGELNIWVNGAKLGSYSHQVTDGVDSHLDVDGVKVPNPAYKGNLNVKLSCDDECNCQVVEEDLTCELYGVLDFPTKKEAKQLSPPVFGYHNDYVTITKAGESVECGYYNKETKWGCKHAGDAAFSSYEDGDDEYYNYSNDEKFQIYHAEGSTHTIAVDHYFDPAEKYYDYDHTLAGTLTLYLNGIFVGEFKHAKNTNIDSWTSNDDESDPNENYKGSFIVTATCDSSCACTFVKTAAS